MGVIVVIVLLSLIGFAVHLAISPGKSTGRVIELLLLYQLIFNVGLSSLLAFYGLAFLPELVAQKLGWPASPFQHELANVNLGFAVLGFMCIWYRGAFWVATIVGFSIWIFADGIGHLIHIFAHNNYTEGNAGLPLYTDLIVPVVLAVLLWLYMRYNNIRLKKY